MYRVFPAYLRQLYDIVQSRRLDCDGVCKDHSQLVSTVTLATSFSPEYVDEIANFSSEKARQRYLAAMLEFVAHEMNVRDLRIGFRWNKLVNDDERFDFSYYKHFFDTCLDVSSRLVLNVGPIKVFRWPEHHVPEFLLSRVSQPRKGAVLKPEDEISKYALEHLERLLEYLCCEYSEEQLKRVTTVQIENEAFHPFGVKEWRFSDEYILRALSLVKRYFPHVGILLNSSEQKNISRILHVFDAFSNREEFVDCSCTVGVNYYYKVPSKLRRFIVNPDSESLIKSQNDSYKFLLSKAKRRDYLVEISEAQWEKWLPVRSPGQSFSEFVFLLLRCYRILSYGGGKTIRLWGVEDFAHSFLQKTNTEDQRKMLDLISRIQKNS